ncbi:MAG: endo-1,4-beta-xylanase, partial [Amphiplicatus sp.]
ALSRRDCLALSPAAALMGCAPRSPAPSSSPGWDPYSLHGLARAKGLGFGSSLGGSGDERSNSFNDQNVRAIMAKECGILVAENEMKWAALRPDAATFDFAAADALVDFAETCGMQMRGHTLLWMDPQWFPRWLADYDFGNRPASEAERLLRSHIKTVCAHYGERIFSYDVINEAIEPKTGAIRDNALARHLGDDAIDIAFDAAREAAPHAELVYNDFMSWGPGNAAHRDGVLRLLERITSAGAPVNALGVQAHIGPGASDTTPEISSDDEREWRGFLDGAAGVGLDIVITELDVGDQHLPGDIEARDEAVAALTRNYLDIMFSYPQTKYVMAWGMVDKYSWLRERWPREDGLPKRPSPYDDEYQAKPLRDAIADAFRAAPARA